MQLMSLLLPNSPSYFLIYFGLLFFQRHGTAKMTPASIVIFFSRLTPMNTSSHHPSPHQLSTDPLVQSEKSC